MYVRFKWYWREGATLVRAILLLGWPALGGRIMGPEQLRQLRAIRRDPPRPTIATSPPRVSFPKRTAI